MAQQAVLPLMAADRGLCQVNWVEVEICNDANRRRYKKISQCRDCRRFPPLTTLAPSAGVGTFCVDAICYDILQCGINTEHSKPLVALLSSSETLAGAANASDSSSFRFKHEMSANTASLNNSSISTNVQTLTQAEVWDQITNGPAVQPTQSRRS